MNFLLFLEVKNETMDKEIKEIKNIIQNIDGWLADSEGEFLYKTSKRCKGKGDIVEIGSWKRRSTIWLGKGSKAGKNLKIHGIDPHAGSSEHKNWFGEIDTFEEFKNNIRKAKVDDIIISYRCTSEEAASQREKKPIEFLWIDGAHEYELVHLDYTLWEPLLIEGGIIAFHDTLGGGPWQVVKKYLFDGNHFTNIGFVAGITFAEKVRKLNWKDRLKNRWVLILRLLYIILHIFIGKLRLPFTLEEIRFLQYGIPKT